MTTDPLTDALARWNEAEAELAQAHIDFARDMQALLSPLLNHGGEA